MESKYLFRAKLRRIKIQFYGKTHKISIEEKSVLYNPKDLFLSGLVSCQMMLYIFIKGTEILEYSDNILAK